MTTLEDELEAPVTGAPNPRQIGRELQYNGPSDLGLPESPVDCFITINHEGRIVDFSPAAERAFRRGHLQVAGEMLVDLVIPPAMRDRQWRGVLRHLLDDSDGATGAWFEVIATRADGSEFPAEIALRRLATDDPPRHAVQLRDVTLRKRRELNTTILVHGRDFHVQSR